MKQSELRQLLQRYQDGQCTPEERRLVDGWYEALGQERELHLSPAEVATLQEALWSRIARQTFAAPPQPAVVRPLWRAAWQWSAAAAVVVGCGLGAWWLTGAPSRSAAVAGRAVESPVPAHAPAPVEWVTQRNGTAHTTRIALQDGSTVALAPASSLRYPRRFRGEGRQVFLSGEAFFEVAHNPAKPFRVVTDKVVTTVLGTSFTVRAFAGQAQAEVKVRTGRVRVSPRWNAAMAGDSATALPASLVLLPNQQAVYVPAAQELTKALVAQPVQLVQQSFVFDDRPVAEVLTALEKAYGVKIVYDQAVLANCSVSLVLRDQSLYGKLDVLCKILGASYDVSGTQILLHARGCPKG